MLTIRNSINCTYHYVMLVSEDTWCRLGHSPHLFLVVFYHIGAGPCLTFPIILFNVGLLGDDRAVGLSKKKMHRGLYISVSVSLSLSLSPSVYIYIYIFIYIFIYEVV